MLVWIFDPEGDLDPGIETLSASPFKIFLWLENDLVCASGDLEMRRSFRPLGVAWGEERHAATVGVGDMLRDRIKHAEITAIAINLEIDLDALGGLSKGNVKDYHCQ